MKDAEEDKVRHQGSRQRRRERRKEKMYSGGERERETRLEVVTQKEKVGKEFNMKKFLHANDNTQLLCLTRTRHPHRNTQKHRKYN